MINRLFTDEHHITLEEFMNDIRQNFLKLIQQELSKFLSIKCHVELFVSYSKGDIQDVKSFIAPNQIVSLGSDLNSLFEQFTEVISEKIYDFEEKGSGIYILDV